MSLDFSEFPFLCFFPVLATHVTPSAFGVLLDFLPRDRPANARPAPADPKMNAAVQSSLSSVEAKLNALLTTLTTSPAAAGAPAAAVALLDADDALSSSIDTLRRHQENYARILRLRTEADQLEDRVKGIVKDIADFDQQLRTSCGPDEDSDSEVDSDEESQLADTKKKPRKEIDYRLLVDFARRISKHNQEAAADAAINAVTKEAGQGTGSKIADKDVAMAGANGEPATEEGAEPVALVTKDSAKQLDESAYASRGGSMPYPTEEWIRSGLMSQIQLADDPDKEMDRLIREAEGGGAAEPPAPAPAPDLGQQEATKAAAQPGPAAPAPAPAPTRVPVPAPKPKPKPKATLDLDLYDPDDDDI